MNIVWVRTRPRSPPAAIQVEVSRNTLYLIADSIEALTDLELLQALLQGGARLALRQRARYKEEWVRDALARHSFIQWRMSWHLGE